MKEIPILFSTPMVQAELEGRKTKTRRTAGLDTLNKDPNDWQFEWAEPMRNLWTFTQKSSLNEESLRDKTFNQFQTKCPYGQPGDLLWVRETLYQNGELGLEYVANKEYIDEAIIPDDYGPYGGSYSFRNIPAIHMPKWAARIWLQITNIRVERLQDITEEDAQAEGMEKMDDSPFPYKLYSSNTASCADAKTSFKFLWQNINGQESWDANPFVWCVSFKVLSTTGKPKE